MQEMIRDYQIVEEIQKGAFCDSYKVKKNEKDYFLKRYKEPTPLSDDFRQFVDNQKMIGSLLDSLGDMTESIVEQFIDENGCLIQVKEYIKGQTLRDWMETNDDYDKRLDVAVQLCECMKAVHSVGIVLQEIKPENVMVVKNLSKKSGVRLVLIDFDWAVPNGNVVRYVGTPGYFNIDGNDLSYKSDIFSLGIVLCELLTGGNPYIVDLMTNEERVYDPTEWVNWVKNKDFTHPNQLNDELSQSINDIIEKCLEPNPEDRPEIDEILEILN